KPNVSAPGVSVRSSVPNGGYSSMSGTSMAGPHVAGAVALLLSAAPGLRGDVQALETIMQATAVDLTTTQSCGGIPGDQIPNNTFGWGRIDAFEAVRTQSADVAIVSTPWPVRMRTGRRLEYRLTMTNAGPVAVAGVSLTHNLPAAVFSPVGLVATPSQGGCVLNGMTIGCFLGTLNVGASATVDVSVLVAGAGVVSTNATVFAAAPDLVPANNVVTFQLRGVACPPQAICR
ncbi:MAG TPA: S8 family serine peptidase, partial [Vicinamibacteria bacterium]|nr:S8 family serine peptidase [Vicinamibacteria bacterium]